MKTYPTGTPCWIDSLQPDPDPAVAFYSALFGWTFEDRLPPGAPGRYLVAALDGAQILGMAQVPDGPPGPARWRTYIAVDDADAAVAAAVAAGGSEVGAVDDAGPAGRSATVQDPTGALVDLWQPRARKGSAVTDAPGTWAGSVLHTPDVDGATAFYAGLGWEASIVEDAGDPRWHVRFAVDDVAATVARAVELGATADGDGVVADPFGARFTVVG